MTHQIFYCNGVWSPRGCWDNDLGLWRARSVVEVLEARGDILFHWADHYERLLAGCAFRLPLKKLPTEAEILARLKNLLEKSGYARSIIHVQVTTGPSGDLKNSLGQPTLTLDVRSSHEPETVPPLHLKTVSEKRRFPQYKLGSSYGDIDLILKTYRIEEEGFNSFLYWDEYNGILEGPYENVFFVSDAGELITPSFGMLPGVTRKILLALARESGIFTEVKERQIHLWQLTRMNEAFLSSTTKGVASIARINDDHKHFALGKSTLTAKLHRRFLKYRESYYKKRGA